jgi:hypothetical protein
MRTALMGLGVVGMVAALALGGCVVDQGPVVGEDTGGAAGTGGSNGTGGSGATAGGGGEAYETGSTTLWVGQVRREVVVDGEDYPELCLPRPLPTDSEGNPSCGFYAVGAAPDEGGCACASAPQRPVAADAAATVVEYLANQGQCDFESTPACADLCVCEVPPAEGADKTSCQNDVVLSEGGEGWCYVSPEHGIGSPLVVSECPPAQKRRMRFLETGADSEGTYFVIACGGSQPVPPGGYVDPKPLGEPCVPSDERRPDFSGFASSDVSIDTNAGCNSNVCLVNHFQGRVSCPYGQTELDAETDRQCFVPGTDVAVTVPVEPQIIERAAERASVCSCRCAGEGPGPFCACPSDMECSPVIAALGLPQSDHLAGSYCIPRGSAYDPRSPGNPDTCDRTRANCGDTNPN